MDAMKLINNLCEGYNAAADEPAMPEQLKPCPACGSASVQLMTSYSPWFTQAFHVLCIDCQMQGPIACSQREEDAIDIQDLECLAGSTGFEAAAIAAWNALPRALRWTHEPPKVAGWYWRKETAADRAHVFHFTGNWEDYGERWESDRVCQLPLILNDNLWAGPIAPPIE